MDLLVVGSVAYDGIETPHGKVDRVLGGAGSYIALAASHFTKVLLVAVVGDDFAAEDEAILHRRNVDLEGMDRAPGKTFYWKGVYPRPMIQRRTLVTELNVFADFQPRLPEAYQGATHILLGNIHPELQASVLDQAPNRALVSGDTMNYWIERTPGALAKTVRDWDSILLNDEEARQITNVDSLPSAARAIREMGPDTIVIKRGEHGATMFRHDDCFVAAAYPLAKFIDPTGAGDAFAGGFMGYLASRGSGNGPGPSADDFRRAVVYGSVMGSFCCEAFGVDGLKDLTRDQIEQRYEELRQMTAC